MSANTNRRWPRAVLACALGATAFAAGLSLNHTPTSDAIAAGILLGIVAVIPAGLLLLFQRMNYRFSLRTLLIATTLVAIGLVVAAYMLGK